MSNPDVPDGWVMPDDLAKKVSEALNKKSTTPEDELQDALNEISRDIALIESNPFEWGEWLSSDHLVNFGITSSPPRSTAAHHRCSI